MDESGEHHSQQTEMNNENTWTQGRKQHTPGPVEGNRGGSGGGGSWGGIAWGEMPNVGEGEEGRKSHCHVCTYATILHVLHMYPKTYNPIKIKKK